MRILHAFTLGLFVLWVSGCGEEGGPVNGGSIGSPRITVISPTPGEEVEAFLRVRLELENFSFVAPIGQENSPNQGHYYLYIDNAQVSQAPETSDSIQIDVSTLAQDRPTEHTLSIDPRDNDGSPHDSLRTISLTWVKLP